MHLQSFPGTFFVDQISSFIHFEQKYGLIKLNATQTVNDTKYNIYSDYIIYINWLSFFD